jgi:hypothetical protein
LPTASYTTGSFLPLVISLTRSTKFQFRFFVRTDRADGIHAELLQPLAGDQADASGGGVPQHGVALLHPVGGGDQVMHGEALQEHRGGLLLADALGQLDHALGGREAHLAVGPGQAGVADAVALLQALDARADGIDHAGRLVARHARQLHGVEPGALVDVDEVDADGGVPQAHLAGAGLADRDVLVDHDLGTALRVVSDCFCHDSLRGFTSWAA